MASGLAAVWGRRRWRAALAAALVSDALSFGLEFLSLGLAEPVQVALDLVTALLIFALLGFRWGLLIPLALEAIPALAAFPTWFLAVAAYAALDREAPAPPAPKT
jgi:hypothetical protein